MPVSPTLLAALTAALLLAGCGSGDSANQAPPARPPVLVKVAKAEKQTVPFRVRAPCLVIPSETVEVQARLDSQVMEVHFKEGDMVREGQLLFTLDDRTLTADLHRQEATLATVDAELANARRQFERARKLAAGGFQSTAELDKARADFESAEARTVATKAEIERIRVLLGYTKITAAITGRAGVIAATVGNTVKGNDPTKPLVVINQLSPIRVRCGLPQQALAPLRELMARGEVTARVMRDGVEVGEQGTIEFIDNNINRTTATFECRAEFQNVDEALWPGMIVELMLALGQDEGVIAIPEMAVQHAANQDFVFVIEDGTSRRRNVGVRRYGEGLAVIETGLQDGDVVAIDGMLSLSDGSPVEIAQARAVAPEAVATPRSDAAAPAVAKPAGGEGSAAQARPAEGGPATPATPKPAESAPK
jgi:multidrug efflux system membrane fusion protein